MDDELDKDFEHDWDALQLRLAAYLSTMADEDDRLVLALPTEENLVGSRPYAQAAGVVLEDGDHGLLAELSSNIFLTTFAWMVPARPGWPVIRGVTVP